MDPRDRADDLLSRARARGAFVVTPEDATSPMDSANTQQIPGSVVSELDQDPDTTAVVSSAVIDAASHHLAQSQPTTRLDSVGGARPTARQPRPAPITEVQQEVLGGLIPTVKKSSGQSNLARRLDGI